MKSRKETRNRLLLSSILATLSIIPLCGQNNKPLEWCDQTVSGVNKEQHVQTAIPFANERDARRLAMEESPYYKTLNGVWKFNWVADPKNRPQDFYKTDYDVSRWDSIKVPSTWQIEGVRRNKNWDKPMYTNIRYPFVDYSKGVQWPNVIQPRPADYSYVNMPNPVGSYRREFTVPESWKGRDVFIRFNGVEAGFYIWVNGQKVGYSEDSYVPAEFNITPYLKAGNNVLAVEVYRFTDASFIEDQDMFRFSGIFRDVFLWSAAKTQIRDFFFRTDLDKDYRNATVDLDVTVTGKKDKADLQVKLTDAEGKVVLTKTVTAQMGENHLSFPVENPEKWTAETPNLYDLTISLLEKGKAIDLRNTKVGFRKIELADNGEFLVNGKSILFKGVDRHEHSPWTGRTITKELMEQDIRLMKQLNVNAVRTSHYPDSPYFYDLCDRYGIYVLGEANLECHGYTELSREPSWQKAFCERSEDQVRTFRNHACIVIWSLGNESGNGQNFKAAVAAVKKLDTTRPTHYEGYSDICDMSSTMYSSVDWLEGVGKDRLQKFQNGQKVRPHIVCEYAHAMGNAVGNFKEYWETYERYPALIGGFIWEWVEHTINVPRPDGKGYYKAVGGDFGDKPNDGNFCADGLIFSDRTYAPKALEVKKIQQPVYIESVGNGRYKFINKRFHTGIDDLYGRYEIVEDGKVIRSGSIDGLKIEPQGNQVIAINDKIDSPVQGADYYINFSFRQKEDTPWAKAGYEVASEQIKLASSPKPIFVANEGNIVYNETPTAYIVKGQNFEATFSKETGTIASYKLNGVTLLTKGPELNLFRTPTDNDKQVAGDWQRKGLYHMNLEAGKWSVSKAGNKVVLQNRNTYKGKLGFDYQTEVEYTVTPDGSIQVNSAIIPAINGDIIPKVGYRLEMPEGFERMRWYGRGFGENYIDRKDAAYMGVYEDSVSRQMVQYTRVQETGNHEDVHWIAINNSNGMGFVFVAGDKMAASALHMRAQDMTSPDDIQKMVHPYEVTPCKETIVCLDAKQRPLGNASCGPGPLKQYELKSEPVVFSFIMIPLERSYTTEDLTEKARVQMPSCMPVLISRDNNGDVQMSCSTSPAQIFYSVNGGAFKPYTTAFPLLEGGKVQAYATADNLSKSLSTTMEFPIYVDRSAWKVVSVSSENRGEEARRAIDGDPSTHWHSRWDHDAAKLPQSIVVDMASDLVIDKFLYTPRSNGNENGRIKDYELYFSRDGQNWELAKKGTFANSSAMQTVVLDKPVTARYFKLVALSEIWGYQRAAAAELNVNVVKNLSGASANKVQVVSVDSEADNSMPLVIDGDANTYWHTVLDGYYRAPYPHEIILSLSREAAIKGIQYTPRQDKEEGRIAKYELYVSKDGKDWGKAVATGTFAAGKAAQTISIAPVKGRFVKLVALSAQDNGKKAAIAELKILF